MAREMKDSGIAWIGNIPSTWKTNAAFQIFTQVKNKNVSLLEQNLLSLSYGRIKRKDIKATDGLLPESFDAYNIVEKGDIVLRLTDLQNDQRSLRVGLVTERGIITSAYLTIRNHSESLVKYLYYYLHAFDIFKGFYGIGSGVRQGLNWDGIKRLEIISPPVSEQARIVSFLDAESSRIDAVIEQIRNSVEECRKLKQSVITKAITKGIRSNRPMKDSEIPWIGSIPDDWSLSTIGKTILFEGGSQPPLTEFVHEPQEGYIRLIQNRDYKTDAYTTYVPIDSVSKFCTEEDVMIGRYGPPMFVMHRGLRGAYNVALMKAIPHGIDREWMSFVLQEFTLLRYVESFSKRAAGQDGVNPKILKNYPLPLPDMEEQREIADYLRERTASIEDMISKKEELIKELNNYKKSLIYEYATGKKEVLRDGVLSISTF